MFRMSVTRGTSRTCLYGHTPFYILKKETKKKLDLDPEIHIFRLSVTRKYHKHIYMAIYLAVLKKSQKWYFFQKKYGVTGQKLWHTDNLITQISWGESYLVTPLPLSV